MKRPELLEGDGIIECYGYIMELGTYADWLESRIRGMYEMGWLGDAPKADAEEMIEFVIGCLEDL